MDKDKLQEVSALIDSNALTVQVLIDSNLCVKVLLYNDIGSATEPTSTFKLKCRSLARADLIEGIRHTLPFKAYDDEWIWEQYLGSKNFGESTESLMVNKNHIDKQLIKLFLKIFRNHLV